MARGKRLTPIGIERAKAGVKDRWLSDDDGTRGGGRLVVRISTSGAKLFYFRYSVNGARRQLPMRPFSNKPKEGHYTLEQARQVARHYAELHRRPESRDVAAFLQQRLEAEAIAARVVEETASAARRQAESEASFTVVALCEWYVEHLRRDGKQSAVDAGNIFRKHLAPTEFAGLPAKQLTGQQATVLFRRVKDSGKGRTAGKLRAFMSAAYALALKAELDAAVPAELIQFGVTSNPIASTATLAQFNRARDRVLSEVELGMVWRQLNRQDKAAAKTSELAMMLCVLLGGQRVAQLLRARVEHVDTGAARITLYDPKGRRLAPRQHLLPLGDEALSIVEVLIERSNSIGSSWLFASGDVSVVPKTVSDACRVLAQGMLASKQVATPFQFRDLRRTAETTLAGMRISKEVRGQIQSHGLGGVQDRHYDKHDYMAEKREALCAWQERLRVLAYGNKTRPHS